MGKTAAEIARDATCGCDKTPLQYKTKRYYFGLENTGTRFDQQLDIELNHADGSTKVVSVDPTGGWLDQMGDEWETKFSDAYPEACEVDNRWWEWRPAFLPNQGTASVPAADMEFPGAVGQFIQFTFCAQDAASMPISATVIGSTTHPGQIGKDLRVAIDESDTEYLTLCVGCGDTCENDEIPKCAIPLGEDFPELPETACRYETIADTWCDLVVDPDPDGEDQTVASDIIITIKTCGSTQTLNYWTIEDENLVEYQPVGLIVNCENGEEFVTPPPSCPPGSTFARESVTYHGVIVDNSRSDGAWPSIHIPNGPIYTLEGELADGTIAQATGTSWWPIRDLLQALGYDTNVACNNWAGCPVPTGFPAWIDPADVPIEELFARGWLGISCGSELVRVEIVEHEIPAWVGAVRPVTIHEGPTEDIFVSRTCDGVFAQDCRGNAIAPPKCCTSAPCASGDSPSGLVNSPCEIEAAESGPCTFEVGVFDSSNTEPDTAVANPDTGVWSVTPSATNVNTSMNQLIEQIQAGCAVAAVFVEETAVSASTGWIIVPAAATTLTPTGYTIDPSVATDFGDCDPADGLAAFQAAMPGAPAFDGSFQPGPLVPAENNSIEFAIPSDGTANGRCLTVTPGEPGELPPPTHQPVTDACATSLLGQILAELQIHTEQNATIIEQNAALIECLCVGDCGCGDECVDSCAWGAGGVDREQIWQASEGGIVWEICGQTYTVPPGDYTNAELAAWLTANTPHTMTLVDPDPASPEKHVILYLSLPCDCEAPTFRFGDDDPVTLASIPDFDVSCPGDDDDDPIGDQTVCATRKMGADFTSAATGEATHTLDSMYDTNGPIDAWTGTFTVEDSAGVFHTFTNGQTLTGLASGSVASVSFSGTVEWTDDDGTKYRCPVTDKLISAGFVVQ